MGKYNKHQKQINKDKRIRETPRLTITKESSKGPQKRGGGGETALVRKRRNISKDPKEKHGDRMQ